MSEITIDNEPVSEALGEGEEITVPNGETWKVTAHISPNTLTPDVRVSSYSDNDYDYENSSRSMIMVDGNQVAGNHAWSRYGFVINTDHDVFIEMESGGNGVHEVDLVLTEGQTISASGSGVIISGFKI